MRKVRWPRWAVALLVGVGVAACGAPSRVPRALARHSARAHGAPAAASAAPTRQATPDAGVATPAWGISDRGAADAVEGFALATDVLPGQPLGVAISVASPTAVTATVFRMGYYRGDDAGRVATLGPVHAAPQAPPRYVPATRTVTTDWHSTLTVDTTGYEPGAYLIRLRTAGGAQRFVPFTVRTPDDRGKIVLVDAVTTWQAYNAWGGRSLYHGPGGTSDFANRSYAVSFDRPYDNEGAGELLSYEVPAIALADKLAVQQGLPIAYATDLDLHADPHLLDGARAVVTLGHDEYWSSAMRAAVTAARDRGVNVAFLGANAVFRHIRLAPTSLGPDRLEIDYKRAAPDPLYGKDNAQVTVDWREPPDPRPESSLTGALYECNPVHGDLVVTDPTSWLYAGLATAGTRIRGIAGSEYDRVNPADPVPHPLEVLTHSPVTCRGHASFTDSVWYTTPAGAGVFDSGTSLWVSGLDTTCGTGCTTTPAGRAIVTAVTTRLLTAFAAGPAGAAHPARDNVAALHEFAGDPTAG